MRSRLIILLFLMFSLLGSVEILGKTTDSTTLNKERWNELTRSLDYTEKNEPKKKDAPSSFNIKSPKLAINSTILKFILFAAIMFFIVFLLYKLEVVSLIRSYLSKKENVEDADEEQEFVQLTPSQELFNEALKEKDHKLSLRLLYLACLHYLAESDILKLRKDTTNSSYVRALSGKSMQHDFRKIVHVHELTWFGDKEISEAEYRNAIEKAKRIFLTGQAG